MTTVVKREFESSHHKCIGCGELRPKEDYTNPLGQSKGLCDHCNTAFLGAEDLKGTGLFEEDDLNEKDEPYTTSKAVMAVSAPKDGETCNCNQGDNKGDHSNANGDLHSMYNQEGGRANWQGQGLPQPKDTCQCDEKPTEADKVPNADARISDKEMKKPKKKGDVGHDSNMEERLARLGRGGKGSGTAAKRTRRRQERLARQDKTKKEIHISDLEEGGDGIYRPDVKLEAGKKKKRKKQGERVAQENRNRRAYMKYGEGRWGIPYKKIKALEDIIKHKGLAGQKGKVEGLDKKLKALEEIIKKRRTRRGGKRGKKGTIAGHTGKWRKTLTPLSGRGEATTPKDNTATADNRAVAAKLGFLTPEPEKKINPKELGKPSKTAPATGVKQFRKPKRRGGANTTGSLTAAQGEADAANTKKQKEENERKAKESKKKKKGMSIFTKALLLAKYRGQKKETAAEKEKKKLEAKLSPEVAANMKRIDDLKGNVDALGRDKRTQHSTSKIGDGKTGTLKLITPQRRKLQRELLANEKKQKEKEKKEKIEKPKIKPKVKPKKNKFPQFGIKAEENQFGAWGQRGLGDGNGTGAIQGAGDTHLISPVKQKELDKLMAGARYMPRSVPRKKN